MTESARKFDRLSLQLGNDVAIVAGRQRRHRELQGMIDKGNARQREAAFREMLALRMMPDGEKDIIKDDDEDE